MSYKLERILRGLNVDIVGVGALNLDNLYCVSRFGTSGEEIPILSHSVSPGGSATNTIVALSRLGIKTGFIGVVGNDTAGRTILNNLNLEGVDTEGVAQTGENTGKVIALIDNEGERTLYVHPGVNDSFQINDSVIRLAIKANFLHLSSFVGETSFNSQKKLLKKIKPNNISFAPGMLYARKGMRALEEIIRISKILFLNQDELKILTGNGLKEGSKKLLDLGANTIVVTLGQRGCYIKNGREEVTIEGYPSKVVDTTGAGDAFAAGFIYGVLSNYPLIQCGKFGNKLASISIRKVGAIANLPTIKDLDSFISSL